MTKMETTFSKTEPESARPAWDVETIRADFPILGRKIRGKPLVYLDNAATSQKPQSVIDAVSRYYNRDNSNVHRGVHWLSQRATEEFEATREKARRFINAADTREIVFVKGTTEAINLVAHSFASQTVGVGDEIVISTMEHHANIVPWQLFCERQGARLRVIPINDVGELVLEEYEKLLSPRTRLVAVAHVSNALGTVNPLPTIIAAAHRLGVPVLIDGAQAVPHQKVDVQALDCDFYCFSSHKMLGPTGAGILYIKSELAEKMIPYQSGGDMITSVSLEKSSYKPPPFRFEAGTPNIAGFVGLGAAIDYLEALGMERVAAYERELLDYATEALTGVPGLRLIGQARHKAAVLSFVVEGVHPHDIGTILDLEGIAIRTGHHCAQPVMHRYGVPATARASLAFYNLPSEIDALVSGLRKVFEVFG